MIIVYHNPRCSKSRASCQFLEQEATPYEVVEYLKKGLEKEEIEQLLTKLDLPAAKVIRKTEAIYKEHYKGKSLSETEWIEALVAHPKLLQRPIIVRGNRAVIARPTELLEDFLR